MLLVPTINQHLTLSLESDGSYSICTLSYNSGFTLATGIQVNTI